MSDDRPIRRIEVEEPLLIAYRVDDTAIATRVYPDATATPQFYGGLIARLVREAADELGVSVSLIWDAALEERDNPSVIYVERHWSVRNLRIRQHHD
jgi:hypothetical protein